jgi:MoxR-like ATPase
LQCYVRSDSTASHLLYTYDALARFSDAHHGGDAGAGRARDAGNYVKLVGLGEALTSKHRRVVLIDELDKAPRDLPNDLLRELDRLTFEIREMPADSAGPLRREMTRPLGNDGRALPAPLIVITSNSERQLPEPFLRRCVFWHIRFPRDEIQAILEENEPSLREVSSEMVEVVSFMRGLADLRKKPSTAELIDWASALVRVYFRVQDSKAITAKLVQFAKVAREKKQRRDWLDLPGLECLIKSTADIAALVGGTP